MQSIFVRPFPVVVALLTIIGLGLPSAAGEQALPDPDPLDDQPTRESWFGGPIDSALDAVGYRGLQESAEDHGFVFEIGLTFIGQIASDTVGGSGDDWATFSYDIAGEWTLPESLGGAGSVGFLIEGGEILGRNDSFDLSANVGSALGINDDADGQEIALTELWYAHAFGDTGLVLTIGKIDQTVFFDANRIANDETTQFVSTPLVNNIAVPFPDNGLGVNLTWQINDRWTVSGGYGDALADARSTGFGTIGDGHFVAGQLAFTPTLGEGLEGGYRALVFYSDPDDGDAAGVGFAISIDQEIAPGVVPFFRYGYAEPGVSDFEHFLSGGIGVEAPFGMANDLLAVGAAWGENADGADELLVEAFYRIQLLDSLAITPAIIWVHDPIDGDDQDVIIASLRAQFTF